MCMILNCIYMSNCLYTCAYIYIYVWKTTIFIFMHMDSELLCEIYVYSHFLCTCVLIW